MELLDRQLVERVVSNAELRCHLEELQSRNGSFEAKKISEAAVVQSVLVKECAVSKNLREITFQEKRANVRLKRQLTALHKDMAQVSLIADIRHLDNPGVAKAYRGLENNLPEGQTKFESL